MADLGLIEWVIGIFCGISIPIYVSLIALFINHEKRLTKIEAKIDTILSILVNGKKGCDSRRS